jgi:hypothetical protein
VKLPAWLLVTVYVVALAVALRDPSEHLLAGAVLLAAVLWRLPATRSPRWSRTARIPRRSYSMGSAGRSAPQPGQRVGGSSSAMRPQAGHTRCSQQTDSPPSSTGSTPSSLPLPGRA